MNIRTLEIFVNLADLGSYSRVAAEMNLSQPAVSMQIKNLEEKMSAELVARKGRGVELTRTGRVFYRRVSELLREWEDVQLEIERLQESRLDEICIGASTIPSSHIIPDLLSDFCRSYPEIKMIVRVGDSQDIIELLDDREIELAVIGKKPESIELEVMPLIKDELHLLVSRDDELFGRDSVSLKEILERKLLIREKGSATRRTMMNALKEAGADIKDLDIRAVLETNEAIISAVEAGLGVSFISRLASNKALEWGRVGKINLDGVKMERSFYISHPPRRIQGTPLETFVRLARDFSR